jgi:hexosaminidase
MMLSKLLSYQKCIVLLALFSGLFATAEAQSKGNLSVKWELTANQFQPKESHQARFVLTNNDKDALQPTWELYFNTIFLSVRPKVLTPGFVMEHLSGDFFRLKPKGELGSLSPGDSLEVVYTSDNFVLKNSHIPQGLYWVKDAQSKPETITDYRTTLIKVEDLAKMAVGTSMPVPTDEFTYRQNEALSLLEKSDLPPFVPVPKSYKYSKGVFTFPNNPKVYIDPAFAELEGYFYEILKTHLAGQVTKSTKSEADVLFVKNASISNSEAYKLSVSKTILVEAASVQGAFFGIQSLLALVSEQSGGNCSQSLKLDYVEIEDWPDFGYRGFFLDIARNFQSKAAILKLLDLLAFYKLNVFHINMANDEAWRIEIPGLPELTEVGSKRGHTPKEVDNLWPYYGSGPFPDQSPQGTGFLSRDDFGEILRYAKARHIQVIPEIGVPAHSKAAIVAMRKRYNDWMAKGDSIKAKEFLLEDFGDKSRYLSAQNFRDNTICVCQESTYRFYEKVVDEILQMYADADMPLRTFHTGGDEVPRGVWTQSPVCAEFLAKHPELEGTEGLKGYFYQRIAAMFASKGLQVAGWEEIGQSPKSENGHQIHVPNQEFADKGFRVYAWNAVAGWGGEDMAYQLANAGYEVIICNSSNFYFDLAYDMHPDEPGHQWSGFVDTKTAWRTVPYNHFISNDTDMNGKPIDVAALAKGKVSLNARGRQNIKGVQGQLWSETVKGQAMMEYYLLPKMLGYVERAWNAEPAWSLEPDPAIRHTKREEAWNVFANVLGQREIPRLAHLFGGFNVRMPRPGIILENGQTKTNIAYPGLGDR